jgi:hypothetical protein
MPYEPIRLVEAGGRACTDDYEFGEAFGEGPFRASGRDAEEPADLQLDADGSALPGQVGSVRVYRL